MRIFSRSSSDDAIKVQAHNVEEADVVLAAIDIGTDELDHQCFDYGERVQKHEAEIMAVSWCIGAVSMYDRLLEIKGTR